MKLGLNGSYLIDYMDKHKILYNYVNLNNMEDFKKSILFIIHAIKELRNIDYINPKQINYKELYKILLIKSVLD